MVPEKRPRTRCARTPPSALGAVHQQQVGVALGEQAAADADRGQAKKVPAAASIV
jgi:hypothetical protein